MIIYGSSDRQHAEGYKTASLNEFDFIHPRAVAVKRPAQYSLRDLASENCEFLQKLGLTLKKKKQ